MTETSTVSFYGNTEDDLHCVQACMRMILGHFLPERNFSWDELDKMSNKHEGMGTWISKMLVSFAELGLETVAVEAFDFESFVADGEQYLRDAFDEETANWQIKHSNVPEEQALYLEAVAKGVKIEKRIPKFSEMRQLIDEGYLVSCNLNSRLLNGEPGYVGHRVLLLAIDQNGVEFHDPGNPPHPNRRETLELFEAAWSSPNETATNFLAVRQKESV